MLYILFCIPIFFSAVTINACDDDFNDGTAHDRSTTPRPPSASLTDLSQDILLNIVKYLPKKEDQDNLSLVSKHFASAFSDFYALSAIKRVFTIQQKEDFDTFIKKYGANDKGEYDDDDKHADAPMTLRMTIKLRGNWVTDEILSQLTNATILDLEGCDKITDTGLAHLTNATAVNLCECYKITDAGLAHLTNATTVNLCECDKITDAGLAHLTNATTVDLGGCDNITDAAKNNLRSRGVTVL